MITVVSATAFRVDQHALAVQRTVAALPIPAKGLVISHTKPTFDFGGEWHTIPECWIPRGMWTREEYSVFMLFGLVDFIDTDFCVTVQHDGYAVNRSRWSNEFLNYDYIGAPWPSCMNIGRVGNGGFSLRSKRWLRQSEFAVSSPPFNVPEVKGSEDCYFCTTYRWFYERAGLRIAPINVAIRWSLEHPVEEFPRWDGNKSFGFHGFYSPCNFKHRIP